MINLQKLWEKFNFDQEIQLMWKSKEFMKQNYAHENIYEIGKKWWMAINLKKKFVFRTISFL